MVDSSYQWIPILSAVFVFIASVGMGANDVSNSFATSVGAKVLTMRQTIMIASVCEFSGAMILGHKVTETIKGSIVIADLFADNPTLLMYGMFTVVIGCALWLMAATVLSLPVSSTHTCIGGMLGMAIVSRGMKSIHWSTVINVMCSWIYSPLIAGFISYVFFVVVRKCILLKEKSFEYSLRLFAPLIACILTLNFFVIFFGGCPWLPNFNWWMSLIVAGSLSTVIALVIHFVFVPSIRQRSIQAEQEANGLTQPLIADVEEAVPIEPTKPMETSGELVDAVTSGEPTKPMEASISVEPVKAEVPTPTPKTTPKSADDEMFASVANDKTVAAIHEKTEQYDIKTEKTFVSLQILAAILNSFAHGANDVSHSIGPFVACLEIYKTGTSSSTTPTPTWVLAFGALGIVLGLATMGHKVMATVGVNLVSVTPCRGFFIELAASFVMIVGSRCGLPLSTTQCKIGAAIGVGYVGGVESVNWKLFGKIFGGWILTIVIAAIVSAALMEGGILIFHF